MRITVNQVVKQVSLNSTQRVKLTRVIVNSLGKRGLAGKSAYEIAVVEGFIGTQAEWLLSLKGSIEIIEGVTELFVTDITNDKVDKVAGYSLTKNNLTDLLKATYDNVVTWISINGTNVINHLSNASNPHNVTKTQVGLSLVDNTSDVDKPISYATEFLLAQKVNKIEGKSLILDTELARLATLQNLDISGKSDKIFTYTKEESDAKLSEEISKQIGTATEIMDTFGEVQQRFLEDESGVVALVGVVVTKASIISLEAEVLRAKAAENLKANQDTTYSKSEVDDQIEINKQNLQEVTDLGSVTTKPITAAKFVKFGGLGSQSLRADGTVFDEYSESVSTGEYFQNSTLAPTTIGEMSITPPLAGTYKVNFNGQFNTALANITQQGVIDLNNLYLNLNAQMVTNAIFPPFTAGSTITPGVYETAGAVSILGSVTLDGLNNPNSIFIFRTVAALSSGAGAVLNLINGATANNVFFIASGAITLGAGSNISGTLISPLAAIGVGAGAFLNGRIFSMAAAISAMGNISVPVLLSQFEMGIIPNFAMFTGIGAVTNVGNNILIGDIGTNNGTVSGFQDATLSGFIYLPNQGASNCQFSIYVNSVIVPTSTRERTNVISKEDITLSDTVTVTAGQTISIKVLNSIGISRFYNRNLTATKIKHHE